MGSRSFVACAMCALALGAGMFAASFAAGELRAQEDGELRAQEDEAFEIGDIYVVGTRRPVRSTADTPAPIDLIAGDDFTDQGTTNLPDLMRTLVPSYNVNTQPISDAATFIRPANLRGLGPDQTLIFVNGKRRHRASVIAWLGNGISEGTQGPDISVIPAIALKRVEVLRDTASAQYGSDAIAGVINFVLKDRPDGGAVETQWGRTYEGDGDEYRIAANVGIPLAESGFANLSAQWHESEPTVRSVQRKDAAELIAGGNTAVRQPYAQIWGQPDVKGDYTLFLNTGVDVSEQVEIYAFGNMSARETEGGFFYRNPNTRAGVFRGTQLRPTGHKDAVPVEGRLEDIRGKELDPGNRMLMIGEEIGGHELKDVNKDTIPLRRVGQLGEKECPKNVVAVKNEYVDVATAEEFKERTGCFVFNERFPGGFTPQFKGEVSDTAGAIGVRGSLDSGMTWDVSYTRGRNNIDFSMRDTINASLGLPTPTQFDIGSYTQTEQTINVDFTREFDLAAFASPLHTATGVEWREEQFSIGAGELASWHPGPFKDQSFGIGANGFSGFSDHIASQGQGKQSNWAGYLDLEGDVVDDLTLATMGRVEKYDTFGSTTDFKLGALYQASPDFGLRGSASTGFRVPTIGQQKAYKVTTSFVSGGLKQSGRLPPTCPEAQLLGATSLEPEEALTFTAGIVAESGPLSLTADVYNIDVDGRVTLSATKKLSTGQTNRIFGRNGMVGLDDRCLRDATDLDNLRYFGNGIDTRTRGVDVVASVDLSSAAGILEGGNTGLVFVGNWNRTTVQSAREGFFDNPGEPRARQKRIELLEKALPEYRFNATLRHERTSWGAFARLNYFGPHLEYHADDEDMRFEPEAKVTVDAEVTYKPVAGMEVGVGAENIFNTFPTENPHAAVLGSQYPESAAMGFAGGFYYARARYTF